MSQLTYLALGDSYTIGEQVLLQESFPYQTVQKLRRKNINIAAPEIIAKTGWTTSELLQAIKDYVFQESYDYVSLLIGVNNQYRGSDIKIFETEFKELLKISIKFSGNNPNRVFVLSIPDWGTTPFADGKDPGKIAQEIDAYNEVCERNTKASLCSYIDITSAYRGNVVKQGFLAPDGLHPSAKEYAQWAALLVESMIKTI